MFLVYVRHKQSINWLIAVLAGPGLARRLPEEQRLQRRHGRQRDRQPHGLRRL